MSQPTKDEQDLAGAIKEQIKATAADNMVDGGMDENQQKLAIEAGMRMMGSFEEALLPIMVSNTADFIVDEIAKFENINNVDGSPVLFRRHKLLPKESILFQKLNRRDPKVVPAEGSDELGEFDQRTFILCKKMIILFGGKENADRPFTEEDFWQIPIEQSEFWINLCDLKRQGFRRDKPKSS